MFGSAGVKCYEHKDCYNDNNVYKNKLTKGGEDLD